MSEKIIVDLCQGFSELYFSFIVGCRCHCFWRAVGFHYISKTHIHQSPPDHLSEWTTRAGAAKGERMGGGEEEKLEISDLFVFKISVENNYTKLNCFYVLCYFW